MSTDPSGHPANLEYWTRRVSEGLAAKAWTVTTAESCTGGWIAKCLTDLPGSSEWFESGYVTYSNAAKMAMLDVPAPLLAQFGAVSEPVVQAMAAGALAASGADCAIAVSGIAGPTGGSAEKPVGTVWLAVATPDAMQTQQQCFGGDRDFVRRQSAAAGMAQLCALLDVVDAD